METVYNWVLRMSDRVAAMIPQPVPSQQSLSNCKIIAHRGQYDNHRVYENTLPAFRIAHDSGVWGIECDIRWTADLVPVVSHDPDASRLFNKPLVINQLSFGELREQVPQIPSLEELIDELGGNTHLMLEIKAEALPDPEQQKHILKGLLSGLSPGEDYHFLFLDPGLLSRVDFVPIETCFLVPQTNVGKLSRAALDLHCGGIAGHYYLLSNRLKALHEAAGQRIGTGFINSRNNLFRELNRGIEWIFSDDATSLKQIRDSYLS